MGGGTFSSLVCNIEGREGGRGQERKGGKTTERKKIRNKVNEKNKQQQHGDIIVCKLV